jgi:hypothetical protein
MIVLLLTVHIIKGIGCKYFKKLAVLTSALFFHQRVNEATMQAEGEA